MAAASATNLLCEYFSDPLGIDASKRIEREYHIH